MRDNNTRLVSSNWRRRRFKLVRGNLLPQITERLPTKWTNTTTDRPTIIEKISISIPILFQLNVNKNTKVKSEFMFNVNVTPHHSCSAKKEQTIKESYDVLWNYLCVCADNKNQLSMVCSMGANIGNFCGLRLNQVSFKTSILLGKS